MRFYEFCNTHVQLICWYSIIWLTANWIIKFSRERQIVRMLGHRHFEFFFSFLVEFRIGNWTTKQHRSASSSWVAHFSHASSWTWWLDLQQTAWRRRANQVKVYTHHIFIMKNVQIYIRIWTFDFITNAICSCLTWIYNSQRFPSWLMTSENSCWGDELDICLGNWELKFC